MGSSSQAAWRTLRPKKIQHCLDHAPKWGAGGGRQLPSLCAKQRVRRIATLLNAAARAPVLDACTGGRTLVEGALQQWTAAKKEASAHKEQRLADKQASLYAGGARQTLKVQIGLSTRIATRFIARHAHWQRQRSACCAQRRFRRRTPDRPNGEQCPKKTPHHGHAAYRNPATGRHPSTSPRQRLAR